MPILTVKVAAPGTAELTRRISATLLELSTRVLGQDPNVTCIVVEYVAPEDWFVGGRSLAEQGKSSVYFEIKITDETRTKIQKAQYIREAFIAFEEMLGDLHPVSYIHVQDLRAAAWGHGGRTQEFRFHQG